MIRVHVPAAPIRPPALQKNDLIALVSTGKAVGWNHDPALIDVAARALERDGYRVRLMPHARSRTHDGFAGTVEDRAADLNEAFGDAEIRAIIGLVGGGGTLDVVTSGLINWDALRRDPKILCGYSDFAVLNIAAHLRIGLITFDGPLAIFHFACLPQPLSYGSESFYRVAGEPTPVGVLHRPDMISRSCWPFRDEEAMRLQLHAAPPWRWVRSGCAQGRLLKLTPIQLLQLTEAGLQPSLANRLWCWDRISFQEDCQSLMKAVDKKLLDEIAGMVVGRQCSFDRQGSNTPIEDDDDFDEILRDLGDRYNIPVLADVDCGHTIPRLTLPNGVQATLDYEQDMFRLDEQAVSRG